MPANRYAEKENRILVEPSKTYIDQVSWSPMSDKVRDTRQFEHLKSKYIGLGGPDTTREEFLANVHRDTLCSFALHDNLLLYNSLALDEPAEMVRIALLKKMVKPNIQHNATWYPYIYFRLELAGILDNNSPLRT